jgi:hypothetical protein
LALPTITTRASISPAIFSPGTADHDLDNIGRPASRDLRGR